MNSRAVVELSIIVPAFDEGELLLKSIPQICGHARQATERFEIVIVDDGSGNSTWPCIQELARSESRIRGLRLSRNFGKDAAVSAGLCHCRGGAAIVIDADLQHPPAMIPEFHRLWKSGYHIVEGVKRRREDEPLPRRVFSRVFNSLARLSTGLDLRNSSDFKLISREVIEAWSGMRESRIFFRGMVEWLGFSKAQVQFDVANSLRSASSWSAAKLLGLSLKAVISFSSMPLRIAHIASACFTIFGLWLGMRALYLWFTHRAVDGFSTVIILALIQGGLTLGILAVMSEYLAAIYEEVKARPRFIVSESTDSSDSPTLPGGSAPS